MKTKTIKIPIYHSSLTMYYDKDLKFIQNKYKTIPLDKFGAVTLQNDNYYRHYIVAFETNNLSTIAHEVVHIINYLYLDCNMQLDRINDEPQAYLTGWIFDEIYKFLYK